MPAPAKKNGHSSKHSKNFVRFRFKFSWKNTIIYSSLFLFLLFTFAAITSPIDEGKQVSISQIVSDVKSGQVKHLVVNNEKVTAYEKNQVVFATRDQGTDIYTFFKNAGTPLDSSVKVTIVNDNALTNWLNILGSILPVLLMILFLWFIFRQARGTQESIFSFGQSRAKLFNRDNPKTTFADVAGVDEAKQELTEIVDFLKNPGKYKAMGARTPKGVLMVGPSGTGKTLLARATAGEANVAFFSMAGSEFMEMLVGVGASVTGDTPILVKHNDITKLVPIGEFVDSFYQADKEGIVPVDSVYTLGFINEKAGFHGYKSKKMQRITGSAFQKVASVYRHKVNEIYEIHYLGGKINATADHSVFVSRNGRIVAITTKDIKKGDALVELPLNIRLAYKKGSKQRHKIISHAFTDTQPIALDVWNDDQQVKEQYNYVMQQKGLTSQYQLAGQVGVSQSTIGNWQNNLHIPRLLSKKLVKLLLPDKVTVSLALMKLFGYYTAEGRGTNSLEFTFGIHENLLHRDVISLMRKVFDVEPILEQTQDNTVRIKYYSAHLGSFFSKWCGDGSHNKHIPEFLWELPRDYFLAFLEGYWEGDGYQTKTGKLSITSVSKQLILELSWLCSMHGIKVGIKHGKQVSGLIIKDKNKSLPEGEYWNLIVGKTANPFLHETITSPSQFKRAIVKNVIKKSYDSFVYDLCGVENEAFFGGEKPVLLHNSRVRDLFSTAKKHQPAILFIDEIDAIGRQRGMGIMGGHDEREQTLNQILVEMDGFTPNEQIVVMAASVTGDTPIMIKVDNKMSIAPIGDFIDKYYKEGEEGVEKKVDNIFTLGFENKRTVVDSLQFEKPAFKSVRSVFRHKVSEIYQIKFTGGFVKATGNHSVFVQEGKNIIAKPVPALRKGEILIQLPYKLPYSYKRSEKTTLTEIPPSAFSLKLPVYIGVPDSEKVFENYQYVLQQKGISSQSTIAQAIDVAQTTVSHWQRQDRMQRLLSRAYFKHELPDEVNVTPELCRLLGYYTAEGYARKEIDFCFNKNEEHLIKGVIQLVELIFKLKPHKIITRGNAVNIVFQSRPLASFMSYHCGNGAYNKHIPAFLFEAPKEYFIEFLRCVFEGDGYEDKRGKGEITSVSKQLITELNWLCRLHGIKTYMHKFVATKGRAINRGKPLKETVAYRLGWWEQADPFSNNKGNFAKLPRIQSVTKMPYDGYVYDLCGCENEAFFGGESPILLHNTNRPDVLDPALVRPGRFDRRVSLDLPDLEGRKAILAIHARGKPFVESVNWEKVARRTVGFSGADLENMLNEAAILAARLNKKAIDMVDLEEAATKVKLGPEKKQLQSEEDRRMTAYHEAGHALVMWQLPHLEPIHRISIVRRGMALGHTMMEPIERAHETRTHLLENIAAMLGGRAAEQIVFDEMTTGAGSDIEKATHVARAMVMKFGMSELGPIDFEGEKQNIYEKNELSPEMAAKVDEQVKKITDDAYKQALSILTKLRGKLDLLAEALLKKETMDADEFAQLIGPKVTPAVVKA